MEGILITESLKKHYDDVVAIDGVSFTMKQGEIVGIVGPNGAGKTTLIDLILGLQSPDTGSIRLFGKTLDQDGMDLATRRMLGVVLQQHKLPNHWTVEEIMSIHREMFQASRDCNALIQALGLSEKRHAQFKQLSAGQKQRAAIAAAMVGDVKFLIMDEPTSNLDPQGRRHVWDMLSATRDKGTSVLLATQFMEEAYELCDLILIIDQGKIVACGTPDGLIDQHCPGGTIAFEVEPAAVGKVMSTIKITNNITHCRHSDGLFSVDVGDLDAGAFELMDAVRSISVPIRKLDIRKMTLEAVFLKLTGRSIRN